MSARTLAVCEEEFPLKKVFTIARGSRTMAQVVTVTLTQGAHTGRGEATPNVRYDETRASVMRDIRDVAGEIEAGIDRAGLQSLMPPGAARNAVDCALWDLEAKATGIPVFTLAGRTAPNAIPSAYTLSLGSPEEMAREAQTHALRPLLKLKLGGGDDLARVAAVHQAAPGARLIVDANEAADPDNLQGLIDGLANLGVEMIEQPLPAGNDAALAQVTHTIPLCADESCHVAADVAALKGRYDVVNIKLDKTGGLTQALELEARARAVGLGVMVGCMVSSSLGLAPAQIVAAGADYVDLDTALFLASDRAAPITYANTDMAIATPQLWG
ncbi:MAG: N-acetyl-D-Glu racemase DgcA [Alphaproteobacteria bacterium]